MPNNYWYERENAQRKLNITDSAEYDKKIQEIYTSAMDNIQKEIDSFYSKYASSEGITMAEAKRKASKLDIETYSRKAKKYVADKNFSDEANAEMKLYNMTMKVNRLELLKANIGLELTAASDELAKNGTLKLTERATSEYERQAGILGDTVLNNSSNANSIVNGSFQNATFSQRIWNNQDALRNSLNTLLSQGIISGQNPRKLAQQLRKQINSKGVYNAERLMRTEMARVQTAVQEDSYKSMGFEEYEFISLGNACSDCLYLNGRHFKLKDMEPGTNAPPIHPNCRCSTAPYMDDKDYDEWLDFLKEGGTTEQWNSLTLDNKAAIKSYVSSDSYIINDNLRNGYDLDDYQTNIVTNLDEALSKINTYNGNLTRSVYFYNQKDIDEYLKEFSINKTVKFKQYLSTTKGNTYNSEGQVQLLIINSSKGVNISSFNPEEDEVLYMRNSSFLVKGIYKEDNKTYVALKECKDE